MNAPQAEHKYLTLDAIRGVAALFVFTQHAGQFFGGVQFPHSYLAVDLFFVMSGFVICAAYDKGLTSGKMDFSEFVKVRLIRLYPLYFLALLWAASLAIHHQEKVGGAVDWPPLLVEVVLGMLILPSPIPGGGGGSLFPLNGPSWSIFFELIANALYAKFRSLITNRALLASIATSALGLVLCALIKGDLDFGFKWKWGVGGFPRVIYSFFAGILIFRLREKLNWKIRVSDWWSILVLLFVAGFLGIQIPINATVYDLGVVLVAFPMLVLFASYIEPTKRLAGVFAMLGVTSYAIYILQSPYVWTYSAVVLKNAYQSALPGLAGLVVFFILCLIVDQFYDLPLRKWLRSKTLPDHK